MSDDKVFCVTPAEREAHGRYPSLKVLVDRATRGVESIVVLYNLIAPADLSTKTVSVHRHQDVDEVIYCIRGAGVALIGPSPLELQEIPFQSPCLLFAPATYFHRVINPTGESIESLVIYTLKEGMLRSFDEIIGEAEFIQVEFSERVRR